MAAPPSVTRSRRDLVAAVAGTITCASPVFLVGALAVQIRADLHFTTSGLGIIAALYYCGSGATSILLGRATEAIGGLRMMRLATLGTTLALLLIALVVRSWLSLAVVMLPAGIASAAMQPAVNLFLARRIAQERQGLAFGLKQSSVPMAAMISGLAVPSVGLTLGWRWSFVLASILAAVIAVLLPSPTRSFSEQRAAHHAATPTPVDRMPLIVLAIGFGLGVAAASSLTAFLVSSAVAGGIANATAGYLVAFGGAVAAGSRILNGRRADRQTRSHLPSVAVLLGCGALGYGALALVASHHLLAWYFPAAALVFGAGWGWNGLLVYAVVRMYPESPARATGITQTGARFGGMLGPLTFGLVIDHASYGVAWLFAALAALLAAGTVIVGGRLVRRNGAALASDVPDRAPTPRAS